MGGEGNPKARKFLGWLVCLGYTSIFAIHYLVAKEVLKTVDPWVLSWTRGWIGGLVLALVFHKSVRKHISLPVLGKMVILAALGFGLNQVLFLYGLMRTTASNAALLSNTIPVVTLSLSLLFGLEKPRFLRLLGIGIAFAGVTGLFFYQKNIQLVEHLQGNLLIFASVFCLAGFLVLAKKLHALPAEVSSPLLLIVGGTLFAFLAGFEGRTLLSFVQESWTNAALMGFEVLISSALAYYLNLVAIRLLPITTVAAFAFLQLPITALLGFLVQGTMPVWTDFFVLLFVACGTFCIYRDEKSQV